MPHAGVADDAFVDEITDPWRLAPIIETDFAVGIPAGVIDPGAEIVGQARHGVSVILRPALLEVPDFCFEGFTERLVGIERKNPVVGSLLGGPVFLAGESAPAGFEDARTQVLRELDGTVDGTAVENE